MKSNQNYSTQNRSNFLESKLDRKVRLKKLKNKKKATKSNNTSNNLGKFLLVISFIFGGLGFGIGVIIRSGQMFPTYVNSTNIGQSFNN